MPHSTHAIAPGSKSSRHFMHRAWLAHALQKTPRSASGSAQFGQIIFFFSP
jgi:hypothetical protein